MLSRQKIENWIQWIYVDLYKNHPKSIWMDIIWEIRKMKHSEQKQIAIYNLDNILLQEGKRKNNIKRC